jgi:hypothetical protein
MRAELGRIEDLEVWLAGDAPHIARTHECVTEKRRADSVTLLADIDG